ncbi:MAG: tRNA (adenosine(37)-N6)-threonylcarbamoyltransferase complex dimerization subunit type 1 TsaB [Muribaculaceae bacterium]|nr:tRNA (adenosine(37)-N6)-threonylcarbamoyltransferase complex dimerization subunit type 1 TsaB [Muribaculaceae bacterium]
MILNIETSSKRCSVAITHEGEVKFRMVSDCEMDHSARLAPFVDEALRQLKLHDAKLEAVAVSMGPGSYTGLRIGLSLAKGLCFGSDLPLIGIPTLELMATKALFAMGPLPEGALFIPMIDARRMEVYTAAYDEGLRQVVEPQPMILSEESYKEFAERPIILIGDGAEKALPVLPFTPIAVYPEMPLAEDMTALSERALRKGDFLDIAYSTPFYLKNFQATTPKNKIFV